MHLGSPYTLMFNISMELRASRKATGRQATQELLVFLGNPVVHYRAHKSPALTLGQIIPVHT
jgi:hypothetical protein